MDDINLNDWLNRKQITLDECLLLSMGENPNNPDTNTDMWKILCGDKYRERQNEAEQWIKNGELKARKINNHDFDEYINLNPLSFFELARIKDWALAESIHDFLDKHQNMKNITWSGSIQPLEPLTDEQRQGYSRQAAWTWVDAIYILQGFKPCPQISTEQVRSHFAVMVHFFTQSIQLGNIGKETTQAGERNFIDSPANWEAFWQVMNKPEPQTEAVGDTGVNRNKKVKGETDRLRTRHFMEWAERTEYKGDKTHYCLQDELRQDKPDLWGKNEETFKTWWKTSEAIPAKELVDRLKLAARQAI